MPAAQSTVDTFIGQIIACRDQHARRAEVNWKYGQTASYLKASEQRSEYDQLLMLACNIGLLDAAVAFPAPTE